MKKILDLNSDLCISCGACAVACMDQHDIDVECGDGPFRKVYLLEEQKEDIITYMNLSMACMHCEDSPCVKGCPSGCLSRDEETGMVVYDNNACIGCHSCSMACPFGAPAFTEQGKMRKCDGCAVRVREGFLPACVKVCPYDALKLYTIEEYADVRTLESVRKLAALAYEIDG